MTPKQQTYVEDIETGLNVTKNEKTAHQFINEHEDKFWNYRQDQGIKVPPSSRQLELIHKIQYVLSVRFNGSTSDDAFMFINKHIKEFRKKEPQWMKNAQFNRRCGYCDRTTSRTNWRRK